MKSQHKNINKRTEFKSCSLEQVADFITSIQKSGVFLRRGYVPVTNTCHLERFVYEYGGDKISIVYDTKAKKLSFESKENASKILSDLFLGKKPSFTNKNEQQKNVGAATCRPQNNKENSVVVASNQENSQELLVDKGATSTNVPPQTTKPPAFALAAMQHLNGKVDLEFKEVAATVAVENKEPIIEQSLKPTKLTISDKLKQKSKATNGSQKVQKKETVDKSQNQVAQIQNQANNNQPNNKNLQTQKNNQKQNQPKNQQQNKLQNHSKNQPPKQEQPKINVNPQFTKQQHTDAVRRLKKLVPSGFDFLSEQSKTDLTIGLIDIFNDKTRLSDYSVLLVPPYRGLERLIFDLQTAQGIVVKMIGQGFEKDNNGAYALKSGYRKKINSIVYNEVLSALYTEYFIERHNCTHSDNTDPTLSRAVTNLQDARDKFNSLLQIIDYNCKKLKEIGFSI